VTDFPHWVDESAPADVVAALHAARAEAPSEQAVARCVRAAVTGGAAVLVTGELASRLPQAVGVHHAGATGTLALLKWGISGLIAGTLVAGGVEVVRRVTRSDPPGAHTVIPAPRGTGKTAASVNESPALQAPVAGPKPAESVRLSKPAPGVPMPPPTVSTSNRLLLEELDLLERARTSLDRGQAARAAELLDEHRTRFGRAAQLGPEARYLRLEAAHASGQRDRTRALAKELIVRDADGPHVGRARELLGDERK
jgi:hypothetical protein